MNLDRGVDCYPPDAGQSSPRDEPSPQHTSDALGGSGDEDHLSCHTDPGREEPRAKKRRKQSNPVRYHTSPVAIPDVPDDVVASTATDAVVVQDLPDGVPLTPPGDVDIGALNLESKRRRREEANGEADTGQRCHHCNALFATEDQLRMHIEEEHVQKLLEKQLQQQQQAGYNRAYGDLSKDREASKAALSLDLGSQNQAYMERKPPSSEADFTKNHPFPFPTMPPLIPISQSGGEAKPGSIPVPLGMFPNPMAPFLFPVLQQGQNPQSPMTNGNATPGGGSMRIFNPEAFCELCNKEFCNKYFLKTHKANKHGIYSVESLVSSPYGPSFFSPSLSNTLSMHQMLQNPMSDPSMAPRQGIINMESFCEICQKEFCNKYFLKKHKQKIHGIVDPSAQQNTATSAAASAASTENSGDRKINASPQQIGPSSESGILPSSASEKNSGQQSGDQPQQSHTDAFRMDFPTMFPGINGKFSMPSITPPTGTVVTSASANSPVISSSISSDPKTAPSFYNQNSSGSDSGSVFTPEKLREMGVINAEAFCEICCKEFCNKYFLRTHKQNKHGIPAMDSPQKNQQASQGLPSSQQFSLMSPSMVPPVSLSQDAPENLSAPSRPGTGKTSPETSMMRSSFANDFEPTTDLTCEICNRPFSSQYLLKMHKFYTHNIPYVKEEDDESKPSSPNASNANQNANQNKENQNSEGKSSRPNEGAGHSEDAASQDLQKLQSMIRDLTASIANENKVACNVCRAEFDNKYFLRAHMMNEHGVLLNEDGTSLTPGSECSGTQQHRPPLDMPPPPFSAVAFPSPVFDSEAYCEICQKEFCSKYFLKTHKQNIHGISSDGDNASAKKDDVVVPKSVGKSMVPFPNSAATPHMPPAQLPSLPLPLPQTQGTDKSRSMVTGRNYCNICNKELCNKYFMKTHMLKMHGINLDEHPADAARNSIIGGVTCEICQKELCSKYFLKVHKQNTHGILDDPSKEISNHSSSAGDQKPDLSPFQPGEVGESNRGFNHYTEVCPLCDRRFKSIKWLKTHMVNDHSDMLKENVYSRGGAVDSALSPGAAKLCIICGQGFPDKVALQIHLIKDHRTTSEELGLMNNSSSDPLAALAQDSVKMNGTAERTSPVFKRPTTGGSSGGTRIYHCSYCVYSTRWLSNLYAHEKRHTGVNLEGEKRFVCRICHRAYRYNHSLQRHLLNHRAAGLSMTSLSNLATVRAPKPQQEQPQDLSSPMEKPVQQASRVKRYRCSKCNKKFHSRELCLSHIYTAHDAKRPPKCASGRPFRCRICGFATRAWNILKRHIMKAHHEEVTEDKTAGSHSETILPVADDESTKPTRTPTPTKTSSGGLPMTYAMPQSPPQAGTFIMQPFLIAQPETEDSKNDTFVPSLVYLPVCQKVSQPMTVAFTLTPA